MVSATGLTTFLAVARYVTLGNDNTVVVRYCHVTSPNITPVYVSRIGSAFPYFGVSILVINKDIRIGRSFACIAILPLIGEES